MKDKKENSSDKHGVEGHKYNYRDNMGPAPMEGAKGGGSSGKDANGKASSSFTRV